MAYDIVMAAQFAFHIFKDEQLQDGPIFNCVSYYSRAYVATILLAELLKQLVYDLQYKSEHKGQTFLLTKYQPHILNIK